MSRKNSCSKPKHGNPGGKSRNYLGNQKTRDFVRNRGSEAREELERIRQRIRILSGLHRKAHKLVTNSHLLTTANVATSHMNTQDFCAHTEDLSCRLFQLELQLARAMQESWRRDQRIEALSRALELQDRVDYTGDENFTLQLNCAGIVISAPSAHMSFLLNNEGLEFCANVVAIHERTIRMQKALERERQK